MSSRSHACPFCQAKIQVPCQLTGRSVKCPKCARGFKAPADAGITLRADRHPDAAPAPSRQPAPAETRADEGASPPPVPAETRDDVPAPATLPSPSSAGKKRSRNVPEYIGRFQVRRFLGEGAFGQVYEAYDPQLDRVVALKVAKPEQLSTPARVKRFLREAKAAANLRHPNIVPVYDSGQDGSHYYIASAYISGKSLADMMRELPEGETLDFRQTAQIVRQLAEALAYAHKHGVIHRDVKPANIMIDELGEPMLMDFGLAARADDEEKLTQEGVKGMGTPAYMAPEQAQGDATAASDQYSLGCTLYELLTGQTPFSGPPEIQLVLHQTKDILSPKRVSPKVSRDLETICLRCVEKESARRFPDCQDLADDLRRWLNGEPIQARRVGVLERAGKWSRRNPIAAGSIAAVGVVLTVGTVVSTGFGLEAIAQARLAEDKAVEADEQRVQVQKLADSLAESLREVGIQKTEADRQKQKAQELALNLKSSLHDVESEKKRVQEQLVKAETVGYAFRLDAAHQALERGNHPHAFALLELCDPAFRSWEFDFLVRRTLPTMQRRAHLREVTCVAVFYNGNRLVSASADNSAKIWDAITGTQIVSLKGHTGPIRSVAISIDESYIVTGSEDKTVRVWDSVTGAQMHTLAGHSQAVSSVAISTDGKRIITAGLDAAVKIWDARTGEKIGSIRTFKQPIVGVATNADASRIVTLSLDLKVVAFSSSKSQPLYSLNSPRIMSLCSSRDGSHLFTGSENGKVKMWDAQTGREIRSFVGHVSEVYALAVSADGKRLVSLSRDRTVRVWDTTTGLEVLSLRASKAPTLSAALSGNGKKIATGTLDTVCLWDLQEAGTKTLEQKDPINSVSLTPDGKRILARSHGGSSGWVLDADHDKLLSSFPEVLATSTNGRFLVARIEPATRNSDGLQILDTDTGILCGTLRLEYLVLSAAIDAEGTSIALGKTDGTVEILELPSGQLVDCYKGSGAPWSIAISDKGRHVAWVAEELMFWRVGDEPRTETVPGHRGINAVALSACGERIIFRLGRAIVVKDTNSGDKVLRLPAPSDPTSRGFQTAMTSDRRYMVTDGKTKDVKVVWDIIKMAPILTLRGHTGHVSSITITPDGRRVITGGADNALRIWDMSTGQELLTLVGHTNNVSSLVVSADGKRLVSASWDRTIKVWDTQAQAP